MDLDLKLELNGESWDIGYGDQQQQQQQQPSCHDPHHNNHQQQQQQQQHSYVDISETDIAAYSVNECDYQYGQEDFVMFQAAGDPGGGVGGGGPPGVAAAAAAAALVMAGPGGGQESTSLGSASPGSLSSCSSVCEVSPQSTVVKKGRGGRKKAERPPSPTVLRSEADVQ